MAVLSFGSQRRPHAAQLPGYVVAGSLFPLPHPFDEGVAADLGQGLALGFQLALDQHLGRDPGVVGAHLP